MEILGACLDDCRGQPWGNRNRARSSRNPIFGRNRKKTKSWENLSQVLGPSEVWAAPNISEMTAVRVISPGMYSGMSWESPPPQTKKSPGIFPGSSRQFPKKLQDTGRGFQMTLGVDFGQCLGPWWGGCLGSSCKVLVGPRRFLRAFLGGCLGESLGQIVQGFLLVCPVLPSCPAGCCLILGGVLARLPRGIFPEIAQRPWGV